jgi:hypothetical protein
MGSTLTNNPSIFATLNCAFLPSMFVHHVAAVRLVIALARQTRAGAHGEVSSGAFSQRRLQGCVGSLPSAFEPPQSLATVLDEGKVCPLETLPVPIFSQTMFNNWKSIELVAASCPIVGGRCGELCTLSLFPSKSGPISRGLQTNHYYARHWWAFHFYQRT